MKGHDVGILLCWGVGCPTLENPELLFQYEYDPPGHVYFLPL